MNSTFEIVEFIYNIVNTHINGAIAYVAVTIIKDGKKMNVPILSVQEYGDQVPFSVKGVHTHSYSTAESTWWIVDHVDNGVDPRTIFPTDVLNEMKAVVEDCVDLRFDTWPERAIEELSEVLGHPVYFS